MIYLPPALVAHYNECDTCWWNPETGYLELCAVGDAIVKDQTAQPFDAKAWWDDAVDRWEKSRRRDMTLRDWMIQSLPEIYFAGRAELIADWQAQVNLRAHDQDRFQQGVAHGLEMAISDCQSPVVHENCGDRWEEHSPANNPDCGLGAFPVRPLDDFQRLALVLYGVERCRESLSDYDYRRISAKLRAEHPDDWMKPL